MLTGTYILRDCLHLSTPLPCASESQLLNPNPLATTVHPPTAGTILSLVTIGPRKTSLLARKAGSSSSNHSPLVSTPGETPSSGQISRGSDGAGSISNLPLEDVPKDTSSIYNVVVPAFGERNPSLVDSIGSKSSKRRKADKKLGKSNSSFVSRVNTSDGLSKRLQERSLDGLFAFANINRAFHWLDLSSPTKV